MLRIVPVVEQLKSVGIIINIREKERGYRKSVQASCIIHAVLHMRQQLKTTHHHVSYKSSVFHRIRKASLCKYEN